MSFGHFVWLVLSFLGKLLVWGLETILKTFIVLIELLIYLIDGLSVLIPKLLISAKNYISWKFLRKESGNSLPPDDPSNQQRKIY